jgi:molybdopterin converting factor small subunit
LTMPILRLFGPARERAGTARINLPGRDVSEVLAAAELRFGPPFTEVLAVSRVWVNGESVDADLTLAPDDEVAVLPPVSGG